MDLWVLITGASSGIGRATAIQLSQRYNVILGGRNISRLQETAAQCNPKAKTLYWMHDVAQVDAIADSLQHLLKENEVHITAFVHCAGYSKLLPLRMTELQDVQTTINTNLVAPLMCVKALTTRRINSGALRGVVLISSNISNRGSKAFSAYGASKGGVDALMRSLAVELAPTVRVNSVLPGAVRTAMTEKIFENEEVIERMKLQYPLGLGSPNDIANAVDFLLSEKANWITGQQITVDGGATINITG